MLILTRHSGESFTIGDDIRIEILGVGSRQVRIGIEAPKRLDISRDDAKRDKHGRPRQPVDYEINGNR